MRTYQILTFSGTGNTAFVAEAVANALREKGVGASVYPLEKLHRQKRGFEAINADIIGIAFPVHSFNPPWLVEQTIRRLPSTTCKRCFIIKTAGSPWIDGGTTTRLKSVLKRRGWKLFYETMVPMPANFVARPSDEVIKLMLQMARKQAEQIAEDILLVENGIKKPPFWKKLFAWLARIERLGAWHGGTMWKVEDTCIKCGRCVRDCPTHNIKMENGRFTFGWQCVFCMRCSFFCPVQAISHKLFGKWLCVKPPFDLKHIWEDKTLEAADLTDDQLPRIRELRQFWWRKGLID